MGRLHQLCLSLAVALGLAGCLLFSDPINQAPTVKISLVTATPAIYRDQDVYFTATISDDRNPVSELTLRWHEFPPQGDAKTCSGFSWPPNLPPSSPLDQYRFRASSSNITCLCAQVTDSNGATGQDCYRIAPQNLPLKAVITDESGAVSGTARPLCSGIRLTAEGSTYPTLDTVQFKWEMQYAGTEPAGRSIQLGPCDGATSDYQHRCFNASVSGTYTVTLTLSDSSDTTLAPSTSEPFVIGIDPDVPPCIRRSDPDAYNQLVLLSRNPDLDGSNGRRTFTVLSVDDDCEPYPPVSGSKASTQFVWSVLDPTQPDSSGSPRWLSRTDSGSSYTVSQAQFPNARPGDAIKVRLEVRDTPVQDFYRRQGVVCPDTTDICCGPAGCTGTNDCVRWTTWTVQFQ